jgi:Tol biopolymer transport system component
MRTFRFAIVWLCCLTLLVSCNSLKNVRESAIFYATTEWPKEQIRLLKPDGSVSQILTESEDIAFDSVMMSPEGTRILYRAWVKAEDRSEFWIMETDDGSQSPIFQGSEPQQAERASWSADGTEVAFSSTWDPDQSICSHDFYVIDLANNIPSKLQISGWSYAWSPTDKRMAILCANGEEGLYIFDLDTGEKRKLLADTPAPYLTWSPDGKSLALISDAIADNGIDNIFVVDIESGELRQVTTQGGKYLDRTISCLSWSPKSNSILFVSDHSTEETGEVGGLFVLDLDSGEEIELAEKVSWTCPVWSPEGDEIAFVSIMNPEYGHYGQIYKVNLATRQITQLTDDFNPKLSLSWGWFAFSETKR